MDVRIRERLVGALVLVAVIVLLVPALLRGPGTTSDSSKAREAKSVEIDVGGVAEPADNDNLVPEPENGQEKPGNAPASTIAATAAALPATAAPEQPPAEIKAALPQTSQPAPASGQAQPLAAEPTAWAVQLGAFSSRSKAEELVTRLRSRGYAAFVLEYRAGGQLLHRVRVGPEQDRARAVAIADRLRKDGFQPVVAPHP